MEFLGVRYAEPPVGDLRFAPPRRYLAPQGTVYYASDWAPDCLANKPAVSTFPNFSEPSGLHVWEEFAAETGNPASEDCLMLNIWTKSLDPNAKKPVMIFIHGGRFTIPGPHSPFYNGQYLSSAEDVVIVTPSYRLGVFGFSGAPGLPQNAALRDHRLAVEWTRDNIAGFGGDASRITLWGQSAGAASVDYYSFAWKDDPIVSGLISQSGTSLSFNPNTPKYDEEIFFNVSQSIGCGGVNDDTNSVTDCVRRANTSAILAAAAKVPTLPTIALNQATFHPTVDGELVFDDYQTLAANGSFARIPYLLGNNDFEAGWYKLSAWAAKINLTESQWSLFNQRAFTCPAGYTARYRVVQGVPTWRYRYYGKWNNLQLYNDTAGLGNRGSATYHGSDLEMVFGTGRDVSEVANSPAEDAVSAYMMRAWAAFARDPSEGLKAYGWPSYNTIEESLVQLALSDERQPVFISPQAYDSPCPAVNDPSPGQGAF
ncbi:cholinesterase precursor [Xylariaceae sp. FL0255]|nr:cholinesterase precursor [Xylariaceae sp. FL0255]